MHQQGAVHRHQRLVPELVEQPQGHRRVVALTQPFHPLLQLERRRIRIALQPGELAVQSQIGGNGRKAVGVGLKHRHAKLAQALVAEVDQPQGHDVAEGRPDRGRHRVQPGRKPDRDGDVDLEEWEEPDQPGQRGRSDVFDRAHPCGSSGGGTSG